MMNIIFFKTHLLLPVLSLVCFFTISTAAQTPGLPDTLLRPADTVYIQKQAYIKQRSFIIPAVLITTGALSVSNHILAFNPGIKQARDDHFSSFNTHADDFLQYAPVALAYGMLINNKQHRFWPYTKKLVLAETMMIVSVTLTKNWVGEKRPDNSAANSFPSGHTAQAFTGATLFCDEFTRHNLWLSATVYAGATTVGVMRVLNNRHWFGDIVAGAGFGILSAKLSEWIIEPHGKKKYAAALKN